VLSRHDGIGPKSTGTCSAGNVEIALRECSCTWTRESYELMM
jgi:hypothetical protein